MNYQKIGLINPPLNQKLIVFRKSDSNAEFAMRFLNEKGDDMMVVHVKDYKAEEFITNRPLIRMKYINFCKWYKGGFWANLHKPE